jgi:hypothetical protein
MDALKVHPVADLFPMLTDDEIADLAEDIRANGQNHPIIIDESNGERVLIDGRNRLKACELLGIAPRTAPLGARDPIALIMSENMMRRHMNAGQRAILLAKVYPDPATLKRKDNGAGSVLNTDQFSPATLSHARTVVRHAPDLADQVLFNGLPLNEAYATARQLKADAETRAEKIEKLRAEAPDLADLAGTSLDAAVKKLEQRKIDAAQLKTIEREAPDLVALVNEGRMSVTDALAVQLKREHDLENLRQSATSYLSQLVALISVDDENPQDRGAQLMAHVDSKKWPPERIELLSSEHLEACAAVFKTCAAILKKRENGK